MRKLEKKKKENNAPGPNSISPEVLKRCEINDIVLNFVNNILVSNGKHGHLGESDMNLYLKRMIYVYQVTTVEYHYNLLLPR